MNNMSTILLAKQENKPHMITCAKPSYNSNKPIKMFASKNMPNVASNSSNINSAYQITKQRLLEIDNTNSNEDEDEWGAIRPTRYAWKLSLEFLRQIFEQIIFDFPLGFANLESDGGVELIWKNHLTKNEVRVSIPSCEGTDISLYIRNFDKGKSKLFASSSVDRVATALQFLYQKCG